MQTYITSLLNKERLLTFAMLLFYVCMTTTAQAMQNKDKHNLSKLEMSIINHEGVSPFAYFDDKGYITIGIGKNIDRQSQTGLSTDEMIYLMRHDIRECEKELVNYDWYNNTHGARKDVLTELCYNMGLPKMKTFKKMISSLHKKDYNEAASQLINSKWTSQVGIRRATNMSYQLKSGEYYD